MRVMNCLVKLMHRELHELDVIHAVCVFILHQEQLGIPVSTLSCKLQHPY